MFNQYKTMYTVHYLMRQLRLHTDDVPAYFRSVAKYSTNWLFVTNWMHTKK